MGGWQRIGILGAARSGLAVIAHARARGIECVAFDDAPAALAKAVDAGARAGMEADVAGFDALVVSPGIPLTYPAPHPIIRAARAAGVPLTSDIDLFVERLAERPVIGVTGTNGKSTTTALIAHLLRAARRDAVEAGNIGKPVMALDPGPADRIFVLELSSYQLDLAERIACRVAVLLNLTPDHLDRHGTFDAYVAAKRRIFDLQPADGIAVVGVDDAPSAAIADDHERGGRRVIRISADRTVEGGVFARGSRLVDDTGGKATDVADLRGIESLEGRHNRQNAAAAYAAVIAAGVEHGLAAKGFASFEGLPHRMRTVARAGTVRFVDDSKATNPEAAIPSLTSFEAIWWIAGGKPKPGGFKALLPHLGAVRAAYLIGEAAEEIAATLPPGLAVERLGRLEAAVPDAYAAARASGEADAVVLLSPACASFDQFTNFEARGQAFAALARDLVAAEAPA